MKNTYILYTCINGVFRKHIDSHPPHPPIHTHESQSNSIGFYLKFSIFFANLITHSQNLNKTCGHTHQKLLTKLCSGGTLKVKELQRF